MALATKCPHCNTVFRVAHDQLKLRGGIVRCGACNEVFDGNAALLEPPAAPPTVIPPPPAPLPETTPFDQKMAALDTRAAEVLASVEAEPVLDLDSTFDLPAPPPAEAGAAPEPEPTTPALDDAIAAPAPDLDDLPDQEASAPPPFPLPGEPVTLPADTEALFDLDLEMEPEPEFEASTEHERNPAPALDEVLNVDSMSEEELEAALEAELTVMEQSLADVQHDADGQPPSDDPYDGLLGGRREPTWGEPLDEPLDEAQTGAGPRLDAALSAAVDAVRSAEEEEEEKARAAARRNGIDADLASFTAATPLLPQTPSAPPRDDELDEVDEEALVQLSTAGLAEAQSARAHAYLHAAAGQPDSAADEEPGFVKRARRRQKYGKAATIAMAAGSVLLLAALVAQAVTTFRNTLAASVPSLKPALAAACNTLGCKIELPTQIDAISIEQGELQTLSETTFSFTTLLRNQSKTAQAWPSIELVLDDDKDKRILRRVFTPRDYLPADAETDKGFAPRSEQAVKLYFELHDLKASGYHIAVFYP